MSTLRFWIEEWQRLKPNAFGAVHRYPWLLLLQHVDADDAPGQTAKFESGRIPQQGSALESLRPDLPLLPLRKRGAGGGARIEVGRASKCDVVIPSASVSKHHATFELRAGTWHVEDANSSNGTWLDTTRLQPWTPVPLLQTTSLWLADVGCRFIPAEALYELLAEGAERLA